MRFFLFLLFLTPAIGQTVHSIRLEGLDFDVSGFEQIPRGAYQLLGHGNNILIRHRQDPFVSMINPEGRLLKVFGRNGQGPGEFSKGVGAMAAYKNVLAVIDVNRRLMLHLFRDGQFKKTIRLKSEPVRPRGHAAQDFAISDEAIVYPAHRKTGFLAYAYYFDGTITPVGNILFGENDPELLEKVPDINDTLWYYQEPYYYCVFKHYPVVLVYDRAFKLKTSIPIENSLLEETRLERLEYDPANFVSAKPIIYDAQFQGSSMFFASGNYIWKVGLETGKVEMMVRFYVDNSDKRRYIRWFHILGKRIYCGGVISEFDLWTADLPML